MDVGSAMFRPGERIGPYVVHALIGVGFMGEVYRAVHAETGKAYALKCLQTRHLGNAQLVERARREARALSEIRHTNIVYVHEAGVTDAGVVWMAMELLSGRSLRRVMKDFGRVPVPYALYFACEIADGVDAAHEHAIVHCDIKPENVFVTDENKVRVLDLGTAKFFGQDMETTGRLEVFGTVPYMSPEHLEGKRVDRRTDVYALGMMLYEMLAGEHPFRAYFDNVMELGRAQLFQEPKPLSAAAPELPGFLWALVEKAIAKDRERRYGSMSELAREIRRAKKRFEQEHPESYEVLKTQQKTIPLISLPTTPRHRPARVFLCYAEEDEVLFRQLEAHLRLLERNSIIETWHNRKILPGQNFNDRIHRELQRADLILLLISASFVQSDYCYEVEMSLALERHARNEAAVIPIIVRPVDWQGASFSALACLPTNRLAVTQWKNRDEAFADITRGIRKALTALTQGELFTTIEPLPDGAQPSQERRLDAAIPTHVLLGERTEVVAMIATISSDGLRALLRLEPLSFSVQPEDVRSSRFELEFPLDERGHPRSATLTIALESSDFEPSHISKKILVPPNSDSAVCTILVSPRRTGILTLQLELKTEDLTIWSQRLRTTGVAAGTQASYGYILTSVALVTVSQTPTVDLVPTGAPLTLRSRTRGTDIPSRLTFPFVEGYDLSELAKEIFEPERPPPTPRMARCEASRSAPAGQMPDYEPTTLQMPREDISEVLKHATAEMGCGAMPPAAESVRSNRRESMYVRQHRKVALMLLLLGVLLGIVVVLAIILTLPRFRGHLTSPNQPLRDHPGHQSP